MTSPERNRLAGASTLSAAAQVYYTTRRGGERLRAWQTMESESQGLASVELSEDDLAVAQDPRA